jgi:hypothetical protein
LEGWEEEGINIRWPRLHLQRRLNPFTWTGDDANGQNPTAN